jgi:hypothetical protein
MMARLRHGSPENGSRFFSDGELPSKQEMELAKINFSGLKGGVFARWQQVKSL